MGRWWLLFVINLPILQEVIRKYFLPSDLVFLSADALVVLTAITLLVRGKLSLNVVPRVFWGISLVFILWTALVHVFKGHHIGIYGVGLRATFLPLWYMLVSGHYVDRVDKGTTNIFVCVNFWILAAGLMAFMQLALGKFHPINAVWGEVGVGIGDYGTGEQSILMPGLFRPTSIFTHTGKFGQAIFTLILFKWCFLAFCREKRNKILYLLMLFDLAAIFASGQRGAVVFLILAVGMIFVIYSGRKGAKISKFLMVGLVVALGLLAGMVANPQAGMAVFERFYSAIEAIPVRLMSNFVQPMGTLLVDYIAVGEGLGFFTFGSSLFGGTLVYRYIEMEGLGESSLIRMCGEVGLICTIMIVVAYLSIAKLAYKKYKAYTNTEHAAVCMYYIIWLICLMMWSNTADIFANSVVTSLGYSLAGAVFARSRRQQGNRNRTILIGRAG